MHRCTECSEKCECISGEQGLASYPEYLLCVHLGCKEDPFGIDPRLAGPERCPYCGTYIKQFEEKKAFWVVDNPTDIRYTAYCSEEHYQIHRKLGAFAEVSLGLPLED